MSVGVYFRVFDGVSIRFSRLHHWNRCLGVVSKGRVLLFPRAVGPPVLLWVLEFWV